MGTDFFDGLGETLSRTAKGIGEKAELIYNQQKLRNKISGENRTVDKVLADLGNIVYKRYTNGDEIDEELRALCEQIDQHKEQIENYREEMERMKDRKNSDDIVVDAEIIDPEDETEPEETADAEEVKAEEETEAAETAEEEPAAEEAAETESHEE